ncbi:hypothetical protein ACJX0J_038434, partial [Zea mays]
GLRISPRLQENLCTGCRRLIATIIPSGFKWIWNSVKGFLDPKTSSKIHVLGSNYQSRLLEVIDSSELPEFLGGSCTCSDKGGCLGSNKGPWNDPYILKLIHNLEAGCAREIKLVSEGEERNSSSFRLEQMKWQGLLSDTSNAESGSDVDDFGASFVKGTDRVTYLSYDDQSHPDMAPESYHGVRRATGMEHHKPMADFSQYSANRRPVKIIPKMESFCFGLMFSPPRDGELSGATAKD